VWANLRLSGVRVYKGAVQFVGCRYSNDFGEILLPYLSGQARREGRKFTDHAALDFRAL
jgi:hypothetical protein